MNPGVWQDIPGFEGLYQIHSAGAVRSVNRDVKQGSRWGHLVANAHRGRVLKPFTTGNGRQRVVLHDAAHRRHSCYIDTLLKTCFGSTGRSDYRQQTCSPFQQTDEQSQGAHSLLDTERKWPCSRT